jgi:HK97 family phage prohead protease
MYTHPPLVQRHPPPCTDTFFLHTDAEGSFSGYASVFGIVDHENDVVCHGAFSRFLEQRHSDIPLLWQHDANQPIGHCLYLAEDQYGLYVEGQILLDLTGGKDAYTLLSKGIIHGLSIGYSVRDYSQDASIGTRYLHDIELLEISLVTFPANRFASVLHINHTQ